MFEIICVNLGLRQILDPDLFLDDIPMELAWQYYYSVFP